MTLLNSVQERAAVRAQSMSVLRKQRGLTFLEVLVALAIGLILVVGISAMWTKGTNTANTQVEMENVQSLITSLRGLRTASGYGASGTNLMPALINSGGVPDSMNKSGTTLSNSWGGSITAVSTGTGFTLTYADVPKANCNQIATKSPSNMSLSLNSGTAITGEVTTAAATAGCSADTNTLAWSGR